MTTDVEKKTVTGKSVRGFSAAADDAASKIGEEDAGRWKLVGWEVEVEPHTESHVQWFWVTLQQE